ncbi:EAL domain-containing protein, partial [Hamadaea sp. NPDC051192]|uniref:putative bifunctional diguanylate cyclase/phosphodiesterase n=1 Tax=Hamadaea sp. NPDC051192 TaxID=3154940 RepID=UPI00342CDF91
MVALTMPRNRRPARPRLYGWFVVVVVGAAMALLTTHVGQAVSAYATTPACWLMTGLCVLAAASAFVAGDRLYTAVVCPSLCFSFAILLCWGLGPAIVAQSIAVFVVATKLKHTMGQAALVAGEYAVALGAAYLVIVIGDPDPFHKTATAERLGDAVTIAGSALAWLLAYNLMVWIAARLRLGPARARRVTENLPYQTLFKASLLLLSPVLAVAAHINEAFVLLIFVPLYAVQRMARLSAERARVARVDPLTGLANRRALQHRFTDMVATREGPHIALLMLDLDRFKHVNDALGHEVGDRLLVSVAQRLQREEPVDGVIGRLGGDEFAILATNLHDVTQAELIAGRLLAALAEPLRLDGLPIDITGSVGIAVYPQHGEDFATLMRHADLAMYEAKRRGDTAAVYDPASGHTSPQQLGLLTDFRQALETKREQVTLHYQPQVSLTTGEPIGVEALLRWRHPGRGSVPTAELLQVAEHTAVMQLLTTRVIDEVVQQVAQWRADGLNLRASLNVSARDLHGGEIVDQLARRLALHGVPPELIQVEITESALMSDASRAHATVERLAALGVGVALDDFGTGYSSLQHLRKLPLTEIKIDQSFVGGMARNSDDAAIVRSTVELARALGLRAVAEGVENEYTRQMLAGTGCTLAQGFLMARPMPGDMIPAWLAHHTAHQPAHQAAPTPGAPPPPPPPPPERSCVRGGC